MPLVIPQTAQPTLLGSPMFNAKAVRILSVALATGDTDLYTVPAGRRLLIQNLVATNYNPANGTVAYFIEVKVAGTYYRVRTNANATTTTQSVTALLTPIILEPGDILAVNCASFAGMNLWMTATEFDSTSPLKCARLLGLNTGDNTLYTCPAGKSALIGTATNAAAEFGPTVGILIIPDGTGRTAKSFVVASGQTNSTIYEQSNAAGTTLTASTPNSLTAGGTIGAGDFVVVNIDTGNAAQSAWLPVLEMRA